MTGRFLERGAANGAAGRRAAGRQAAERAAGLAWYVGRRFQRDGALNMASSLSYTSLLSLVPLLAIGLAMLAAFPVFDPVREKLEAAIFRYFVPEVGEQVQAYVSGFVANAGKLTAAGVVGLAFSAVMVLVTIESSLNQIFRVATPRSALSRLLVYWTALTLGPLLLGFSLSLSALFDSASARMREQLGLSVVTQALSTLTAPLLLALTFSLLFFAVPNRRVRWLDAGLGGLAAAAAFTLLRWGFTLYVAGAHAYQNIYGAVATVPIFLFWMYLCWAVILFGAELAAALPEWRLRRSSLGGPLSVRRRLTLALTLLAVLLRESLRGGKGRSRLDLLETVGEGEHPFLAVLDRLCEAGYVIPTAAGRYVLGRDLAAVTLGDVVGVLGLGLGHGDPEGWAPPWMRCIGEHLSQAAEAEMRALDLPLRSVLQGWEEDEEAGRLAEPGRQGAGA